MRSAKFFLLALAVGATVFALALLLGSGYLFFAGYVVLQFIVLATAWNILGGYCGYVNFGSAAFFAIGTYTTVALQKVGANSGRFLSGTFAEFLQPLFPLSIPTAVIVSGAIAGVIGLGMGYLTLRLRGVFFAIATLAMAVVLQTLVINWDFVGGSRGAYIIRPASVSFGPFSLGYIEYLFLIMLVLAVIALSVARLIERSRLGYGFATIRDDEMAAEAAGVPTLRLKLIATTVSGAFMGMAGAPYPYYIGYVEPGGTFGLQYAVNSIAMPMIGGTTTWAGPLIGAILLGSLQQIATVTISSAVNLLLVGVLLVVFVIIAPKGIVGLVQEFLHVAAPLRFDARAFVLILIAGYCFIIGILGIILSLSVFAAHAGMVVLAALNIAAVLNIASAYGLLALRPWSPMSTTGASVAALVTVQMWPVNTAIWSAMIAMSIATIVYLQIQGVKQLYRRELSDPGPAS
jgi:branched-chain amino acid transport system permease protein